ncbi:SAM-dependent methyltransferase [Actinoplanes sp. ATCC 53533]|uniref:class I SAM-dependent methyltransferase n=1 Tax=Actinoplanes sp. ATCC 53533 TaxID=1288362 RepID=UPI000F7A2821|nr:class I SAM-dependent methyltransferase [Actinoplanes sp. ATCC 53533]RSM47559.1 SAM-dependent methyltransferase [Actinoplanes sp. ATCC 53533]
MTDGNNKAGTFPCRICGGTVREWFDFGPQPISNAFTSADDPAALVRYDLVVGLCDGCTMVQQREECAREEMFRPDYPYRASGSALMCKYFEEVAEHLVSTELTGPDPFLVEIGSNDGVMLRTVRSAGIRHLGVDPSRDAAEVAAAEGVRVRVDFFEESTAASIRADEGAADVIFSANTISHISYIDSILRGVATLLAPRGVFVFEDRYLGDIVERSCFDQLYDEHFYLFAARSVQAMLARFGLELVDVEHRDVHGGTVRYTVALAGARTPTPAVATMLERERRQGLAEFATYEAFATRIDTIRDELVALLTRLHDEGKRVVGYGATSKSATVTNYCGIGPELVPFVCDSTAAKQGRLAPGSGIPVRPQEVFSDPYPAYALLFAWNHADEIMTKEHTFAERGGRWIQYVPTVHIS